MNDQLENSTPSKPQRPAHSPTPLPTRGWRIGSWVAQFVAAGILGQTLFFKFTGAPEAVALFEKLGAEPWGRFGTGAAEAVAVVLLLIPRLAAFGGSLAVFLMVGAIGSHLTRLGIVVNDDGGSLFAMAVVVLVAGALVATIRRGQLLALLPTRTGHKADAAH